MPENEIGIPTGDYKDSCGGCRVQAAPEGLTEQDVAKQKMLICSDCPKSCGTRIEASIDLGKCKVEDGANIYNHNGELKCDEPLPGNAENLPHGSFSSSCHGCSIAGTILTCTDCLDGAKERHLSSIDTSTCKSFGNNHGKLECADAAAETAKSDTTSSSEAKNEADPRQAVAENEDNIPAGTYTSSCGGCYILGTFLTCRECLGENEVRHLSSLDISNCKSIGNNAGQLECEHEDALSKEPDEHDSVSDSGAETHHSKGAPEVEAIQDLMHSGFKAEL